MRWSCLAIFFACALVASLDVENFAFYSARARMKNFKRLSPSENAKLQLICGQQKPKSEPRVHKKQLMIDSGTFAKQSSIPWAASLSHTKDHNNFCGATLISTRHLISAAHCFYDYKSSYLPCKKPKTKKKVCQMRISLGGVCLHKNPDIDCNDVDVQRVRIAKFAVSKKFNEQECMHGNDLAIIELVKDVKLDNTTFPVCLPPAASSQENVNQTLQRLNELYSFGFGRMGSEQINRLKFFHSHFSFEHLDEEKGQNDLINAVADQQPNGQRPRICPGDSGGGLLGKEIKTGRVALVGVHSYASACDENEKDSHTYASTFIGLHLNVICAITGVCRLS
ncbi:Trypsin family protein [Aphelenchoides besseyi]|nr:Trypsin family protein [Aphelenchoides besseyi]KAI6209264.1 Trypsin family protein [Aphelenchoides besseyi]